MTTAAASAPALDDRGKLDRPATLEVHDHAHCDRSPVTMQPIAIAAGRRPPATTPPPGTVASSGRAGARKLPGSGDGSKLGRVEGGAAACSGRFRASSPLVSGHDGKVG
jgi:hypothetical protein